MIKTFKGPKKYNSRYEGDLLGTIQVYEMTAQLCNLCEDRKRKGIIVMLHGPALTYFVSNSQNCKAYEDTVDGLIGRFSSEKQGSRILQEWQVTRLSK